MYLPVPTSARAVRYGVKILPVLPPVHILTASSTHCVMKAALYHRLNDEGRGVCASAYLGVITGFPIGREADGARTFNTRRGTAATFCDK